MTSAPVAGAFPSVVRDRRRAKRKAAWRRRGLVLGGALGWLVGIGALAIPGLGPLVATAVKIGE